MKIWVGAIASVVFAAGLAKAQTNAYFPPSLPSQNAANAQQAPQTPVAPDPAPDTSAAASSYQDITSSAWSSQRQISNGVTTCDVHSLSSAGDPLFLFGATSAPGYITLQISKAAWVIPTNTQIHLHAAFDDSVSVDFTGTGNGTTVKAPIGADTMKAWIHGLTAANTLVLSFVGGTASPWSFSLTGTTQTVDAMAECAKEADLYLPAPFNTGNAPGVTANPDGQPFAAAQPGEASQTDPQSDAPHAQAATIQAAPPTQAPQTGTSSPASAPTDTSAATSCSSDWHSCKDNADLVNNSGVWPDVQAACQEKVNDQVSYGSPKWPGFWSGGPFASFHDGTDYVTTGIVLAIEPNVQIQNQYGAMVHSTAYCRYDLGAKSAVDAWTIANDGSQ